MTLKRAIVPGVLLGALIILGPAWAGSNRNTPVNNTNDATAAPTPAPLLTSDGLVARSPLPKLAIHKPEGIPSRLFVKFRDDFKARPTADKTVRSAVPTQGLAADTVMELNDGVSSVEAIRTNFGLQFVPAIKSSEQDLSVLQDRAASYSGKAQPDLAGMMYVDGPENVLVAAAQQLQALDIVEYAYFQQEFRPSGGQGACCVPQDGTIGCGGPITPELCETLGGLYQGDGTDCVANPCPADIGACCLGTDECEILNEVNCDGLGGRFGGVGSNCNEDGICDEPDCGEGFEDCFTPHADPFCNDEECCELVGDVAPYCIDDDPSMIPTWDEVCVALAHLMCDGGNRCASPFAGPCFNEHPGPGCNNGACCADVCAVIPFCCEVEWNADCALAAFDLCSLPPDTGTTPNFADRQGYLRAPGYENPGPVPNGICGLAPDFPGFNGAGWSLFDPSQFEDNPNASSPSRYLGLYGLGRNLNDPPPGGYGIGQFNGARGRGIKVAVIEWAYYQGHEDLDVIDEPGQTLIMIPSVTHPDHATACLGIINARDDHKGVVGIAPDAQAYFFPLTSAEEGPRTLTAFTHALQALGAGDVISCSFGPGPVIANLNNEQGMWPLIRLGADLGVTICIAAGNDCFNLDDADNLGESGGCVVGASYPGSNHCRLSFSNFDQFPANTGQSNTVHINAWGECVTSTGGSNNLFFPSGNANRGYCSDFNGTSAATPQVAALVACLQGMAKQFYGVPLLPTQIRAALGGGAFPQCGVPNPADLPGFDPDLGCGPDLNPDEDPNLIGPYPNPYNAGGTILSQTFTGFDQSPLVDDVVILRGTLKFGNRFSIKANEQNYLVVTSKYTTRKVHPSVPGPAAAANYLGNGQVFDVMVKAHSNIANANAIAIDTNLQFPGTTTIWMIELYDWTTNHWNFVDIYTLDGITNIQPDGDHGTTTIVNSAARYINPTNKQILVRAYATILGLQQVRTSAAANQTDGRIDWINVRVSTGFGVTPGSDGTDPGPPTD